MTQTIDQRARELLGPPGVIDPGRFGVCYTEAQALAALTEALTRVEELEGALNRIVAKDSYINSTIRSDSPNGERLVIYGDIADIARTTLSKGITE